MELRQSRGRVRQSPESDAASRGERRRRCSPPLDGFTVGEPEHVAPWIADRGERTELEVERVGLELHPLGGEFQVRVADVPERFHMITPQLVVSDANAAIAF